MNLKFLLKSVGFLLCSSLCIASENYYNYEKCEEIIEKEDIIKYCRFDDNGNINLFEFFYSEIEDFKQIEEIVSKYKVSSVILYTDVHLSNLDTSSLKSVKDLLVAVYIGAGGRFHEHRKLSQLKTDPNLNKLGLEGFILSQQPIDFISNLTDLTELKIDDCELDDANTEPLKKLKNLTSLKVHLNYNTGKGYTSDIDTLPLDFPEFIYSYRNLKNLDITINNMDKSGEEFLAFKNLEKFSLDCQGDDCSFKKNIFTEFKNLKELYLKGIDLSQDLIDDLGKLSNLKNIKFAFNYNDNNIDYSPISKIMHEVESSETYPKICRYSPDNCKLNKTKTTTKNSTTKTSTTKTSTTKTSTTKTSTTKTSTTKTSTTKTSTIKTSTTTKTSTTKTSTTKTSTTVSSNKTSVPTSTKGKCGKEYGQCPAGECCSQYGYCGKSDAYCGKGCQSEFGKCQSTSSKTKVSTTVTSKKTSVPTSTNGKCGKEYGQCPAGECCSQYGYCGRSDAHCGKGCQSEFGKCQSTSSKTKVSTTMTSKKTSVPTSTNGKCGKENGKCPSGECCSQYGYCGRSDAHCGKGCQSEFGKCQSTSSKTKVSTTMTSKKTSVPTSTNGKCGKKYGQCPSGECCSKYGYCGKSDAHCGTGCQSEFGTCKSVNTTGKCGKKYGKCPSGECCSKYGYCGKSDKYCGNGCQSEFGNCK